MNDRERDELLKKLYLVLAGHVEAVAALAAGLHDLADAIREHKHAPAPVADTGTVIPDKKT